MIVVQILLYILLSIIGLVFIVIIIPYKYAVDGRKQDETYIKGWVSWLFGGLKVTFAKNFPGEARVYATILGFKMYIRRGDKDKAKKAAPKKRRKKAAGTNMIGRLRSFTQGLVRKVLSALGRIIVHISPRILYINAVVGFDDPAYTGWLNAAKEILAAPLARRNISIRTVFDEERLEGEFLIRGRIWLVYVILVAASVAVTKPFRNMLIESIKSKKRGGHKYVKQF